jgi:hypothetical protein
MIAAEANLGASGSSARPADLDVYKELPTTSPSPVINSQNDRFRRYSAVGAPRIE